VNAADIAAVLGDAGQEGSAWRCRCPLHGGRSLLLRDGDAGCVLVTCWGGCDRLSVLAELRARGLLDGYATARFDLPPGCDRNDHVYRIARARRIWDAARDAGAGPVARYLASRGIVLDRWPPVLRYHAHCPHPSGEPHPAMVALVEHAKRGIVGIHRTYLTADHKRRDRASLGPSGAVRLSTPRAGEWFAVGEGIETVLAVSISCSMPAWAAISANGVRALVLPPEATHIVICADHDASGTGECAAHDAAARWVAEGRRVRIAMPPEPDTDMADVLAGGSSADVNGGDRGAI
jgi:hypothetical protein